MLLAAYIVTVLLLFGLVSAAWVYARRALIRHIRTPRRWEVSMDPEAEELIDVLEQLIALLESNGDTHWSAWMRRAKSRLEDLDVQGAHDVRCAYGGMGSFNDFYLGQVFIGSELTLKPDRNELNAQLDQLRSRAFTLAIRVH